MPEEKKPGAPKRITINDEPQTAPSVPDELQLDDLKKPAGLTDKDTKTEAPTEPSDVEIPADEKLLEAGDEDEKTTASMPSDAPSNIDTDLSDISPEALEEADAKMDEDDDIQPAPAVTMQPTKKSFWHWFGSHKKLSIPLVIVILLGILGAVPFTRYAIAGTFWKQTITIDVMDSQTHKAVSNAMVEVKGVMAYTDGQGKVKLKVKAGNATLKVSKNYYATATKKVLVPVMKPKSDIMVDLQATGRQVPITVTDKITGKVVSGASIKASDTEATTDSKGQATLVLPADKSSVAVTISASGHNDLKATVQVTTQAVKNNTFQITPSGKVYFLSNLSGKIDVVKTNLDGTGRQTVLAGTGSEDTHDTLLVASRDWKYLALLSKRDGGSYAKLFLIDTSNDSLTTMDEGNAIFTIAGWSNHRFIYNVNRAMQPWQPKREAIKSFDASTKKIATLDESMAYGGTQDNYLYQTFDVPTIFKNGEIVYAADWVAAVGVANQVKDQSANLTSIKDDGSSKHVVKSFQLASDVYNNNAVNISTRLKGPSDLYLGFYDGHSNKYYEYTNSQIKEMTNMSDEDFASARYNLYQVSPSGSQTLWAEPRDGQNVIFVGDENGANGKKISPSGYKAYGWYGDNFILLAKGDSQLYIMPVAGGTVSKVSDYYTSSPTYNTGSYTGYGW